jgi:hypothetical protein
MAGIVNKYTGTIHKQQSGASSLETKCGLAKRVSPQKLERMPVERAVERPDTTKCGRCFSEAGGY